ncbi:MAG: hypothetical protein JST89_13745 [Cyanobacteria bacterium SZAS-4]|nr:hypothetical protein [Cyanobacteria bacterium SZAS-4]
MQKIGSIVVSLVIITTVFGTCVSGVSADQTSVETSVPFPSEEKSEEEPIRGFHPIKKAIAPIIRLEKNSIALQKQISELTRPIENLSPVMLNLHKGMDSVNNRMSAMQTLLNTMSANVSHVSTGMDHVGDKMEQVRSDIGGMRAQIGKLEIPIRELQKPLHELEEPLQNIAQPLRDLHDELNQLKALMAIILFAIVACATAIAVGTPVAAVLVYKNRAKIFPHLEDTEIKTASEDESVDSSTLDFAEEVKL